MHDRDWPDRFVPARTLLPSLSLAGRDDVRGVMSARPTWSRGEPTPETAPAAGTNFNPG